MSQLLPAVFCCLLSSCAHKPVVSVSQSGSESLTGSGFFTQSATLKGWERDSLALAHLQMGHFPSFLKKLAAVPFNFSGRNGRKHQAVIWVTPDYISIGNNNDWVRMPLTPVAAARLADKWNCVLPTPAMVDAIYEAAAIKLEPVPLYAHRDSTPIIFHHHLIIEGQRQQRKGLIAGIKKDVVRDNDPRHHSRSDRVIIYGWHRLNGEPIQPVYSGHVNWYVDYSHGIRLVSKKVKIDGKWSTMEELEKMMER